MRLRMSSYKEMRKCCALLLTENNMFDAAYQIEGLLFFQADRNQLLGKTRGRGLGAYINTHWCTNCSLVSSHCSEAVEYVTLKCQPHYLPRESTVVFIVTVYVPSSANANVALGEIHSHICELQTRGNNTLDQKTGGIQSGAPPPSGLLRPHFHHADSCSLSCAQTQ